jgi:hypothetical protein
MHQKNMIPILLIYSWDVLFVKNIYHACSLEKYSYVIYVHLFTISCKIARAKNMNKTWMWNFLHNVCKLCGSWENTKSIVWYFS